MLSAITRCLYIAKLAVYLVVIASNLLTAYFCQVETVGDAYVVVSGCPKLNGIKHTSEIASMALELLSQMVVFRVRHLPDHQLQLRIGINTGKACCHLGQAYC